MAFDTTEQWMRLQRAVILYLLCDRSACSIHHDPGSPSRDSRILAHSEQERAQAKNKRIHPVCCE